MKILVIRLSSIGDVILTTPVLKQLKEKYPDAAVDFLVMKNFKDSIEGIPYIDNLILFDKKENDGYQNITAFGKKLAENKYDYVFDLHSKIRSKIISKQIKLSGAKVLVYPKRKWWKSLLVKMKLIKYHVDDTIVKNYFKPFKKLGLKYRGEELLFAFSPKDLEKVKEYEGLFVMAPGASKETKKWTKKGFGNLAKKLYEKYNIKTVLIGGREDIERCDHINKISGGVCINLAGKLSLKESGALLSLAKLMVTNDSGPFHIGRGVGCRTYVIFGPTDPDMFEYDEKSRLIYKGEKCSPCSLHGNRECRKGHLNCMNKLSEDIILKEIEKDMENTN